MRTPSLLAVLVVAALVAAGCGGADDTSGGGGAAASSGKGSTKLSLVAYSTPQVVYDQVIPGFQKTAAGKGVSFAQSYGASGDQSRAVEGGLAADVVTFSLEPDMTRLVKDGLVAPNWASNAHKGLVSRSVVALIVRKGNPKNIRTWDDLLKPGVKVLTPEPVYVGRGEVEHPGGLRGQERRRRGSAGGAGLPARADDQARHDAGQVGPRGAAGLRLGQWRRPDLL